MDKYLSKLEPVKSDILDYFRDEYKALLDGCFDELLQNSKDIDYAKDYRSYYIDQYEMQSNIDDKINNTLFIELKLPQYSADKVQQTKMLYDKLKIIKSKLFELLISKSDKDTLLWQNQYNIHMTYCQEINNEVNPSKENTHDNKKKNKSKKRGFAAKILYGKEEENDDKVIEIFNCKIIIGVSFRNKNYKYGLKTFGNSYKDLRVNYPVVNIENYVRKNYETSDIYEQYILLFKHIVSKSKSTKILNSDLVEMMLYNVPNNCYKEYSKLGLLRIINYLRNYSISDYITIDEQNHSFSSSYKEYSIIDAKELLKLVEKYIINLK